MSPYVKWLRKRPWAAAILVPVIVLAVLVLRQSRLFVSQPQVAFSDFVSAVEDGKIREVTVSDPLLVARLDGGRTIVTVPPSGYVSSNPGFVADLVHRHVKVVVQPAGQASGFGVAAGVLAMGLFVLAGFTIYRVTAGRVPSIESRAHESNGEASTVTFADVAGVDEAKDEVREIVEFLRAPEKFGTIGGRMPKGVLLVGPPGTGKTLLARSIAGEARVPFLFSSGADFVEMYAGVGASRVRKLFREASRHKSCIVFIDELDAVGRRRGGHSLSHEEREQTLNQLLVEMDGFAPHQGLVVIAATNRHDILDPALLRPGRFDRQVMVGAPDLKGREAILRVHTRKVPLSPDIDLRITARGTPGFSGADLANLVNEAALLAARHGRPRLTNADLDEARDKVLMGVERRSLVMTERERLNCAYHEAGHALVAAMLPEADPLHKVTIVPRGRALGVTMQLPEADRHMHTKSYLETQVAVLMGGRVAEEIFMNHMTSGASNDIERATEIAQNMVCEFGMSTLGPLMFRKSGAAWDNDRTVGLSEETARRVDEEVRQIVMRGYETARQIVQDWRPALQAAASELLEVESLEGSEFKQILARCGAQGAVTPEAGSLPAGAAVISAPDAI